MSDFYSMNAITLTANAPPPIGHNKPPAQTETPAVQTLPAEMEPLIAAFVQAKRDIASAEKIKKNNEPLIKKAIGLSRAARCGKWLLTLSTKAGAAWSIKTTDGQTLNAENVGGIVLKTGEVIPMDKIASLYGGRAGWDELAATEVE
jgi:hypothetical protein